MEGTHTFPQSTPNPSSNSEIWKYQGQETVDKDVLAKMQDEQILSFVRQEQMEWEASQGAGHQPIEDRERGEMIIERYEDLIKQRNTAEKRDKIKDILQSN